MRTNLYDLIQLPNALAAGPGRAADYSGTGVLSCYALRGGPRTLASRFPRIVGSGRVGLRRRRGGRHPRRVSWMLVHGETFLGVGPPRDFRSRRIERSDWIRQSRIRNSKVCKERITSAKASGSRNE